MGSPPVFMMGEQAPPPPELLAHIDKLNKAQMDAEAAGRRQVLSWSAILCSCRVYFDWKDRSAPQAGCIIHGSMMMTPEGEVIG